MGYAICAYLGYLLGHEYIWQSFFGPEIRLPVHNAMLESVSALNADEPLAQMILEVYPRIVQSSTIAQLLRWADD